MNRWGIAALGGLGFIVGVLSWAKAQIALPETVETTQLAKDAFSTGTLKRADGALAPTLWQGSDAETLEFLLVHAPARPATPAIGEALRRTLLSSGTAPEGAAPSLGGKKLLALSRAGFLEEANTVASISSGGRGDPWSGQALAISDLLKGDTERACQRNANLTSGRDEPFWVKLRVLCYAAAGEGDAADLTLNVLRENGALSADEEVFLIAIATGAAPKSPPAPTSVLEYAIAKKMSLPLAPGLLRNADGGVLAAIARDGEADAATRIAASMNAAAMGVLPGAELKALFEDMTFDIAAISDAAAAARDRPNDPQTDAQLYHSVKTMSAPEFLRDKAQRISLALGLGDNFSRAYGLALLYADEVNALDGAIVSAQEAERFAIVRMAAGDSAGAGHWLLAMLGGSNSVSALPEPSAMAFIDRVNLLALLDPQTAAQVARAAGVALLSTENHVGAATAPAVPALTARILEAAFDAAVDGKAGQAGLAAIAASSAIGDGVAGVGEINAVIVNQALRVAGMEELRRRHDFEQAWAASFADKRAASGPAAATANKKRADFSAPPSAVNVGIYPRLKPAKGG